MRRVDVRIDELVLDGFSGVDADAVRACVADELSELVAGARTSEARPGSGRERTLAKAVRDAIAARLPSGHGPGTRAW